MDSTDTDQIFASLGGSLMKDLWADLQVDGDDDGAGWSLEQLERELASMEAEDPPTSAPEPSSSILSAGISPFGPPVGLSAASIVVSHQKDSMPLYGAIPTESVPAVTNDAWSKSLEKFTSTSLEEEFLKADSVRKQTTTTPSKAAPPGFMADAEEYNVDEKVTVVPPLGMPSSLPSGSAPAPAPAPAPPPGMPKQLPVPKTPNNSILLLPEANESLSEIPVPSSNTPNNSLAELPVENLPTKTPSNSLAILPEEDLPQKQPMPYTSANSLAQLTDGQLPDVNLPKIVASVPPPTELPTMPTQVPITPQNSVSVPPGQSPHPQMMPVMVGAIPPMGAIPPGTPQGVVAVASPMVKSPPMAWQQPSSIPKNVSRVRIYCNVHPAAPPVRVYSIKSSRMMPRDLTFVIHSLLKPILLSGTSPTDYHMRCFAQGRGGPKPPNKKADWEQETVSRQNKTKEWMKDTSSLGYASKANVTKPRALIATPTLVSEEDVEQKQRASLWKARLLIDQAYQACNALVEVWQAAPPGTVPPEVRQHLRKLFKCLGMTVQDGLYSMDPERLDSIRVITKMSKGRVFLARLFDQALLPPKAVQVLLPSAMAAAVEVGSPNDMSDNRLFGSMTRVVATLPGLETMTLLKTVEAAQSKQALASQARMECMHALLQRGNVMASKDSGFTDEWKQAETEYMKFLE